MQPLDREGDMQDANGNRPILPRTILIWVQAIVLAVTMVVLAVAWLYYLFARKPDVLAGAFDQHFAAVVGVPAIGMGALVLVLTLRQVEGPIKFEGLGFKFEGAAAPIVLWTMTFLAMCVGAKLLW
jgi:hypothetical protein